MIDQRTRRILTINTGSSSLKAALYDMGNEEQISVQLLVERIALSESNVRISDANCATLLEEQRGLPNHAAALLSLFTWLHHDQACALDAIGHRVVHGGSRYNASHLIDSDLMQILQNLVPVDPGHLPQAINAIQAAQKVYRAFHRSPALIRPFTLACPTSRKCTRSLVD